MPVPFVVRVQSADGQRAEEVADAIRAGLTLAGAHARVECSESATPTVTVSPGIWNDQGGARWLDPITVPEAPEQAAITVVQFLERWGFIARAARRA